MLLRGGVPFGQSPLFQQGAKTSGPKGKERGSTVCALGLLENTESLFRPHACESSRKVKLSTSREWALFKKDCPTNVTMAKLEEPAVLPSMLLALLETNKLRASFLPRELTYVLSILSAPRAKIAS